MELTKTQIDRLGDRLKRGDASDEDLRLLDSFRLSFARAFEDVVRAIRDELELEPTGRAKSNTSITEKLRREHIRLTQMQDIAGCRIVVADSVAQGRVVTQMVDRFPVHAIFDRRREPSHGYRAVHMVVAVGEKQVEIQARTQLQHLWAELSEKMSDVVDPSIKYGGGDDKIRSMLSDMSAAIKVVELREQELGEVPEPLVPPEALLLAGATGAAEIEQDRADLMRARRTLADLLRMATALVPTLVQKRG